MPKAKKLTKAKKKPSVLKKKLALKVKKKVVKKVASKRKSKKASAIPKGYHSITPYLIVSDGAQAIEFYKKAFGAKEMMRMEKPDGKIGHAELKIGDARMMLADVCPEMGAHSPEKLGGSPVGIHLYIKDVDMVVERAVKAGAKLERAVENMFYGDRSGALEDPYGHKWYVSTHIEDVSPSQIRKRAAKLFEEK
jgi:PhnB protein